MARGMTFKLAVNVLDRLRDPQGRALTDPQDRNINEPQR